MRNPSPLNPSPPIKFGLCPPRFEGIESKLDSRNVKQRFHAILKACGLPRHRFHDLRHSAATLLLVQGVHPRTIQQILGWDRCVTLER